MITPEEMSRALESIPKKRQPVMKLLMQHRGRVLRMLASGISGGDLYNHMGGENALKISLSTFRSYLSRLRKKEELVVCTSECTYSSNERLAGHTYDGKEIYEITCLFPVPVWLIGVGCNASKPNIVQKHMCKNCLANTTREGLEGV